MRSCPSPERLELVLAGRLSLDEEVPITTHVQECVSCQEILESLTKPDKPSFDTHVLGESPPASATWPDVPGYEILGELGRGGMGVVYKARQTRLNRLVALKMVLFGSAATPEQRIRFEVEGQTLARLRHPNIVQIHEVGSHKGRLFLALELVEGGDLAARLTDQPLPPREAARVVAVLAEAIHYAHGQGVVHRDLKPGNILLSGEWRVTSDESENLSSLVTRHSPLATPKISDFGLAKHLEAELSLTESGAMVGTPSYMPPEQVDRKRGDVGPPADVYALGAILYALLTGRPPFLAATTLATVRQVLDDDPPRPRQLQPDTPRDLETICLKCLRKEPRQRYASAADLAADLGRFLEGRPVLARPVGSVERGWKWARRKPAAAALLAVLVVAVLGGGGAWAWFTSSVQKERDEALYQKGQADEQRQRAEAREAELARELDIQSRTLFTTQLLRVRGLWQTEPAQARALLDDPVRCPPRLRDFAWGFYDRLCRREPRSLTATAPVCCVAFSPDGKSLAAGLGGFDRKAKQFVAGEIHLYDAATGKVTSVMRGHTQPITALAFNHDGTLIASGTGRLARHVPINRDPGELKLWDVASGQERASLTGHGGTVMSVAFAPDGKTVAASGGVLDDGEVLLWDVATGKQSGSFTTKAGPVYSVATSPDGKSLAGGTGDIRRGDVLIWDVAGGQLRTTLKGHSKGVLGLAFSPDGKTLASASGTLVTPLNAGEVKLWNLDKSQEVATLKGHTSFVASVAFSPDGRSVASAGGDGKVNLWNASDGQLRTTLPTGDRAAWSVAFDADGQTLAAGVDDGTVRLWPTSRGPERATLRGHTSAVTGIAFGPGNTLASASEDGTVRVWDAPRSRLTLRGRGAPPWCVAFNPDGTVLASGGAGLTVDARGQIRLWDVQTGGERSVLDGGRGGVKSLAFLDEGRQLVAAHAAGDVTIWDLATGHLSATIPTGETFLHGMAVSPDGRTLALAHGSVSSGVVSLWGVRTRERQAVLGGHAGAVMAVAWSPDGGTLVSGSSDGTVSLWGAADNTRRTQLAFGAGSVLALAFTRDGKNLIAGGGDAGKPGVVKVWDSVTGQERVVLEGHADPVWCLAFDSSGTTLASGGGQFLPAAERCDILLWESTLRPSDPRRQQP